MGMQRENGYSASVEAFLVVGGQHISVAKTGRDTVTLVEPCDLPPGTECDLVMIVDGHRESRAVVLDEGAIRDQREVYYSVAVPF
ncbi:MAG: hypothetical protein H0T51_09120 [Pirellulales bacterium]|nr:hypothetical protein [Pirellulales bacterium]